ncbi:hypothetical protein Zmor_001824 [Zophobas morio]|uniref:Uncharacterized protein n=1 Tax=Zophobas morio TaxID=2755281 RepID=A0AA38MPM9_9CUCU|nr:hypothetical protein Zmor_001824 [Zophobas morio]
MIAGPACVTGSTTYSSQVLPIRDTQLPLWDLDLEPVLVSYGPAARDYPTLKYVPGDMDALAAIPREMEVFLRKRVAAPELNISFCDV